MPGDKVFSLCHMNIRSLKAKLSAFQACLDNIKLQFSALGISETWLNDWNSTLYNIQGYNFIEKHRSEKRGGGEGIYLKEYIEFESVFIEINKDVFRKNKNLIIGVIYRPPDKDLKLSNTNMEDSLANLKNENKYCYLMGDYNINILNYEKHFDTTDFVDLLHANSYISLLNRPTRVNRESATLIDNIFTNAFMNLENSFQCLIYTGITDHFPLIHLDLGAQESDSERFITRQNLSMRNKRNFTSAISTLDRKCIYDETDMQNAFTTFHSVLLDLYNTHFPKQKVKYVYDTRKPWLWHGLGEAIKKKWTVFLHIGKQILFKMKQMIKYIEIN